MLDTFWIVAGIAAGIVTGTNARPDAGTNAGAA